MRPGFHWQLALWNALLVLVSFLAFGVESRTVAFAVFAAIIILGLALWARKQISEPLSALSDSVGRASRNAGRLAPIARGAAEIQKLSTRLGEWSDRFHERLGAASDARIRFEAIVAAMAEGVLVFDSGGRVILGNEGVRRLARTPADINGKTCLEIFRNESFDTALRQVLRGEGRGSAHFQTASGREVHVLLAPIASPQPSAVEAVVAVFHDLTEIRGADRIRRDFVANVSHEFKTPLTSILGYAETLASEASGDSEREFAEIIRTNARHLESLVNDLLALARLEGPPSLTLDSFDLQSAINEQVALRRRREHGAIAIEIECPPIEVCADRARLGAALGNLIDNALRYNRDGGMIRVTAREDGSEVVIDVEDSGVGIDRDELPRIFERFYRVDRSRARDRGGTGLGLAIARHAIESQGGVLTVESKLGSGSTFTIRLPSQQAV